MTKDLSHLHALELGLSHERERLALAKTDSERKLRAVYVAQREKEIAGERKFLGLSDEPACEMSDDDLMRELEGL